MGVHREVWNEKIYKKGIQKEPEKEEEENDEEQKKKGKVEDLMKEVFRLMGVDCRLEILNEEEIHKKELEKVEQKEEKKEENDEEQKKNEKEEEMEVSCRLMGVDCRLEILNEEEIHKKELEKVEQEEEKKEENDEEQKKNEKKEEMEEFFRVMGVDCRLEIMNEEEIHKKELEKVEQEEEKKEENDEEQKKNEKKEEMEEFFRVMGVDCRLEILNEENCEKKLEKVEQEEEKKEENDEEQKKKGQEEIEEFFREILNEKDIYKNELQKEDEDGEQKREEIGEVQKNPFFRTPKWLVSTSSSVLETSEPGFAEDDEQDRLEGPTAAPLVFVNDAEQETLDTDPTQGEKNEKRLTAPSLVSVSDAIPVTCDPDPDDHKRNKKWALASFRTKYTIGTVKTGIFLVLLMFCLKTSSGLNQDKHTRCAVNLDEYLQEWILNCYFQENLRESTQNFQVYQINYENNPVLVVDLEWAEGEPKLFTAEGFNSDGEVSDTAVIKMKSHVVQNGRTFVCRLPYFSLNETQKCCVPELPEVYSTTVVTFKPSAPIHSGAWRRGKD